MYLSTHTRARTHTHTHISHCRNNDLGPEGGTAVARALTALTGLRSLDIR